MTRFGKWMESKSWIWSFIGAAVVFLIISVMHGKGIGATITTTLSFAVFSVIVGTGQMLVMTTGPGNIDLSIPSVMTLGGAIAMKVMNESAANIPHALIFAILAGVAIGVVNYGIIWLLRIPPIIATLSTNLIVLSIAIMYERGLRIHPPDAFYNFTVAKVFGIPVLAIVVVIFTVIMSIVLSRTVYGRSIIAIGQNPRAARLVGIKFHRIKLITYVFSALFAAVAGSLLASFSGGSSLDLGNEYLMGSIAVVIIGGTNVAGGDSNVAGIWGAALFLYLLRNMMNTFGISEGLRLALTGIVIVGVIVLSGGKKEHT